MANGEFNHTFLMHHGIKGQKWGVRRFQNEDGSLTYAGKKRYIKTGEKAAKAETKYTTAKRKLEETKTNRGLLREFIDVNRPSMDFTDRLSNAAIFKSSPKIRKKFYKSMRKMSKVEQRINQRTYKDVVKMDKKIQKGEMKLHKLEERLELKSVKRDKYPVHSYRIEHSDYIAHSNELLDTQELVEVREELENLTSEELKQIVSSFDDEQYKVFCCLLDEVIED